MAEKRPFLKPEEDSSKRRSCMLIITHDCNLNCSYCYESHKDKKKMSFELAKECILKEIDLVKKSEKFKEIQIDFMGGEPLMNFDLIKQVVEWLEDLNPGIPYVCFATTNGTLLNEERKKWFRKHKNTICLGASYDGTEEMQQANRHTGKGKIDLDFFHEIWPFQGLHVVVSKSTLNTLFDGLSFILKKGWLVEVALAQGEDWTREDAIILKRELRKFAKAYFAGEFPDTIDMLKRDLFSIGDNQKRTNQRKYCGSGTGMVTYEVDGKTYGCHMFTPLVLGEDKALELQKSNLSDENIAIDERCQECILAGFCGTCMGFNYRYRGELWKKDMRFCFMNLAIAEVALEFQAECLSRENNFSQNEAEYAKSVLSAYPILSKFSCETSKDPFVIEKNN